MGKEDAMQLFCGMMQGFYETLNRKLFGNELPVLPFEPVNNARYAACVYSKQRKPVCIRVDVGFILEIWKEAVEDDTDFLFLDTLVGTLVHEMVHVYCMIQGIRDFVYETGEHLPAFEQAALEHGLMYQDGVGNLLLGDAEDLLFGKLHNEIS